MCKCPSCNSSSRRRLTRNFILKLIPNSKFYKCYKCKTKFISIPYLFSSVIFKKGTKSISREIINEENLLVH